MKRIILVLGITLLIASCVLPGTPDLPVVGSALVRSGRIAFRIGGRDSAGNPQNRVSYASILPDGSLGYWYATRVLPFALADASAVAVGDMLYILGGTTPDGLSDKVLYAKIKDDGSFVFGWTENDRPLPWPVTDMAAAVHDGRIFLAGGHSPDGSRREIIHARIRQDGQLGQWYLSPERLPYGLSRSAAIVVNDRLYLAGGRAVNRTRTFAMSFGIGVEGLLNDPVLMSLPETRERSILVADGLSLVLYGGITESGEDATPLFLSDPAIDTTWMPLETGLPNTAVGPGYIKARGKLYTLDQHGVLGLSGLSSVKSLFPDFPSYYPGSGYVPSAGFYLRSNLDPGSVVSLDEVEPLAAAKAVYPPVSALLSVRNGQVTTDPVRVSTNLSFQPSLYASSGMISSALPATWTKLLAGMQFSVTLSATKPGLILFTTTEPALFNLEYSANLPEGQSFGVWLDMYEGESPPFTPVLDTAGLPLIGLAVTTVASSSPEIRFNHGNYSGKSSEDFPSYFIGIRTDATAEQSFHVSIKAVPVEAATP